MNPQYTPAYFTLTTTVLPSGTVAPNAFGALIGQTTKQSMMWSNIDLLTIMGNKMFTKYKYFNITLTTACMGIIGNLPSTTDSRLCLINLKGLDFVNCSYSISNKCKLNTTQIGFFNFGGANNVSPVTINSHLDSKMFLLGGRFVDLYISLNANMTSALIDQSGLNGGNFPHQSYTFRIDPIEGY